MILDPYLKPWKRDPFWIRFRRRLPLAPVIWTDEIPHTPSVVPIPVTSQPTINLFFTPSFRDYSTLPTCIIQSTSSFPIVIGWSFSYKYRSFSVMSSTTQTRSRSILFPCNQFRWRLCTLSLPIWEADDALTLWKHLQLSYWNCPSRSHESNFLKYYTKSIVVFIVIFDWWLMFLIWFCSYGAKIAEVKNAGLGAAEHALGTAWTVIKIIQALNPKSALKPSSLAKTAIKRLLKKRRRGKKQNIKPY